MQLTKNKLQPDSNREPHLSPLSPNLSSSQWLLLKSRKIQNSQANFAQEMKVRHSAGLRMESGKNEDIVIICD